MVKNDVVGNVQPASLMPDRVHAGRFRSVVIPALYTNTPTSVPRPNRATFELPITSPLELIAYAVVLLPRSTGYRSHTLSRDVPPPPGDHLAGIDAGNQRIEHAPSLPGGSGRYVVTPFSISNGWYVGQRMPHGPVVYPAITPESLMTVATDPT